MVVPLTSGDQPPPDRPAVVGQRRREQNRTWCVIGTFVLCALMIVSLFVLVLLERPTGALAAVAGSEVGLMTSWQIVVRHYFPAPRAGPPRSSRRRLGQPDLGGDPGSEAA